MSSSPKFTELGRQATQQEVEKLTRAAEALSETLSSPSRAP